ncbi:hypothetical protein CDAR_415591 [Caerostris darwini]|uniref:Uncharacterized protein n=1 Tax=Caerostris darwini TaxID=1538125 RepID=A0AAV4Q2L4_9ARAC|nr:hypothetical protein CDAR_415591 [Caerostris darwini]
MHQGKAMANDDIRDQPQSFTTKFSFAPNRGIRFEIGLIQVLVVLLVLIEMGKVDRFHWVLVCQRIPMSAFELRFDMIPMIVSIYRIIIPLLDLIIVE